MERFGYENKRNCSECGQLDCLAIVNKRLSDEKQAQEIKKCQDRFWIPVDRKGI